VSFAAPATMRKSLFSLTTQKCLGTLLLGGSGVVVKHEIKHNENKLLLVVLFYVLQVKQKKELAEMSKKWHSIEAIE
jgi:hypothetical protein